jgi:NAD(P)-dependent dehydrogenase (short-subunit alcohol dehydrogenase family)
VEQLDGRVAVVTGAASGIGRALALRFGAEGMKVVAADVERDALEETGARLRDAGVDALVQPTDVSDAPAVDALAAATYDAFGAAHVVCNNAGVFQGGVLWQRSDDDWRWVLGVNLYGIVHGIRAFVPRMIEQGGEGHVVNTASMAGITTAAYSGPYHVSKFAAVALSECLANDLRATGSSIGVSVLCPGAVDTRIAFSARNRPTAVPDETAAPDAHFVEQALRDLASKGLEPAEVADLVVDAIRTGRFWVPTNDSYDDQVRTRYEDMIARRAPRSATYD